MNPILLAGPTVEPVELDEMKRYLRLDGDDEDELVAALIVAGRVAVETRARIALLRQVWHWRVAAPGRTPLRLPVHPVLGIEGVRAETGAGDPVALPSSAYRLDGDGSTLVLTDDETGRSATHLVIELACGFGSVATDVPEPLILAVKRLAAYWFERRGDEDQPARPGFPADAIALIAPFVRPRLA